MKPYRQSLRMTYTNTTQTNDRFLTIKEVSVLLGLSATDTRTALRQPGAPKPIWFNKRIRRYRQSEVLAWIGSFGESN